MQEWLVTKEWVFFQYIIDGISDQWVLSKRRKEKSITIPGHVNQAARPNRRPIASRTINLKSFKPHRSHSNLHIFRSSPHQFRITVHDTPRARVSRFTDPRPSNGPIQHHRVKASQPTETACQGARHVSTCSPPRLPAITLYTTSNCNRPATSRGNSTTPRRHTHHHSNSNISLTAQQ